MEDQMPNHPHYQLQADLDAAIAAKNWRTVGDIATRLAVATGQIEENHPDLDDDLDTRPEMGCGEFDTVDSKGCALRPAVNDAGEPWWM